MKTRVTENSRNRFNNSEREFKKREEATSVAAAKPGMFFSGIVRVERVAKPGPTILTVSDGYGMIDAVTMENELKVGDIVHLRGDISERAGKLQVEIKTCDKAEADFDKILADKAMPVKRGFSIPSNRYAKMESYFTDIAYYIRRAILENKPILIRHHADADGIIAGMAIEKSCKMLMEEVGINPSFNLYRNPSKAPFYEKTDMFRDITLTNRVLISHGQKKPLIIVLDNGSTPEDVFAMKTLSMLGFEIIVIDHHNPVVLENKTTAVCKYLKKHLNPYIEGFDGQTSAGMLSYEVARLIHKDFEYPAMPAISAVGDRCVIPEAEAYLEKCGLTREDAQKKVIAIDFIAYHLKFDEGEGIYEMVLSNDDFVDMINEEVRKGVETQLQTTMPYLRTQDINGVVFSHIDLEKYTLRFTYPTAGKVTGMIHDIVAEGKENVPVITAGHLSDMIILRATKPVLPIASIIKKLRKDIPEAAVDGGGHECAGTIKFVSAHLNAVLENVKQQIRNLDYREMNAKDEEK